MTPILQYSKNLVFPLQLQLNNGLYLEIHRMDPHIPHTLLDHITFNRLMFTDKSNSFQLVLTKTLKLYEFKYKQILAECDLRESVFKGKPNSSALFYTPLTLNILCYNIYR